MNSVGSADIGAGFARQRLALFEYGFRPFFLFAGIYAIIVLAVWLSVFLFGGWPEAGPQPHLWHAHEMLFGFVAAAIAGFLLTAVPNWSGRRGYRGAPLVALVSVWVAGRLAMALTAVLPAALVAVVDLAFFPALVAVIAPSLIKARRLHNLPFILFPTVLFAANLLFHLEWMGWAADTIRSGILLAVGMVSLMIVVIGGRIVPSFTLSALRRAGSPIAIPPRPWLDASAIGFAALVVVVDLVAPDTRIAGAAALGAALSNGARLARWRGNRTLGDPLLWVLHLGYAWIVIGFALKAAWLLAGVGFAAFWMHALTAGAFATMILAVTTRASLGHTGRPLAAPGLAVLSYILITVAAAMRVFGPALGLDYPAAITTAGACWIAAFLLFVVVYAPILLRPRPDGRPG